MHMMVKLVQICGGFGDCGVVVGGGYALLFFILHAGAAACKTSALHTLLHDLVTQHCAGKC